MFLIVIAANWHLFPRESLSPELSGASSSIPGAKDLLLVSNVSTELPLARRMAGHTEFSFPSQGASRAGAPLQHLASSAQQGILSEGTSDGVRQYLAIWKRWC